MERVSETVSEPSTLGEAKCSASAERWSLGDWIAELNKIAAAEVHRVCGAGSQAMAARSCRWSLRAPTMRLDRKLRDAIIDAELLAMPMLSH